MQLIGFSWFEVMPRQLVIGEEKCGTGEKGTEGFVAIVAAEDGRLPSEQVGVAAANCSKVSGGWMAACARCMRSRSMRSLISRT